MKTIRWGIIGCGDVCEVKSGPGFQKANHSQLVAVMRRDGDKARDYAQRHGVPQWYDEAQALIHDPQVDAVYIATPPGSHEEYAIAAAQAGKPVYVEKPMARSFAECTRMIEAAEAANVPLWVAYYRRRLPRFLKVEELLKENAIGALRAVTVRHFQQAQFTDARTAQAMNIENLPWRVRPEIAGGGLFLDLAAHTLDLLDYLLGPMHDFSGTATNQAALYPAEDSIAGHWTHGGIVGNGVWCFCADHNADTVEIVGDRGRLHFSTFGAQPIELRTAGGVQSFDIAHPPHVQQPLIQTIVDELNGTGTCPSTGHSAARTNRVMDAMLKRYRESYPAENARR